MPAGKFARPRLTLVLDEDVVELVKKLAENESIPTATYAAALFSQIVRNTAKEKGFLGEKEKKQMVGNYKT